MQERHLVVKGGREDGAENEPKLLDGRRRDTLLSQMGRAYPQAAHHLDEAQLVRFRPDLVWRWGGQPAAVVDAKIQGRKPAGFPDADLYQLLAYRTALHLPRGYLVYARGHEEPARYIVHNCGIEITGHALDLSRAPDAVLEQIRWIAREVVA